MGSEYTVIENDEFMVMIDEMSNRFDLRVEFDQSRLNGQGQDDYYDGDGERVRDRTLNLGRDLTSEQIAEIGLRFLKVALYWPEGGDVEEFRRWLHKRVDEVDHSQHTPFAGRPPFAKFKPNTTSTEALHVATGPEANVVIKCTAVKSMTAYKLLLHATEPDGVLIHSIETDHGGERKTAHPGLAKIAPFSVAKWNTELNSPLHDGPYLGKLAAGESLYFTVEFTKASTLSILVGGPLWRDQT